MICLLAMDVDGTLTDGKIYLGNAGEEYKAFCVKDGQGIALLHAEGIKTAIITGRSSSIVDKRAKELGIPFVMQDIKDKAAALRELAEKENISLKEIAYIGDDINDLPAMKLCGLSFSPSDAVQDVRACSVNLKVKGGEGAVRECAEYILNLRHRIPPGTKSL